MGRPPQCNPCCGQWYTTEKLTYDGGIKKLADTDYFYDHPLVTDDDLRAYYYGSTEGMILDDFSTLAVFPNTNGNITVYTKDGLKELLDGYDSNSIGSVDLDPSVQYDDDAEDILPNNRRYNPNLSGRIDANLDYGEYGQSDINDNQKPDMSVYYRNYDNPVLSRDVIWYQSILDRVDNYNFETIYNDAFAALNPTYRDIPANYTWDGDYELINYHVSDKIYCIFRLGKVPSPVDDSVDNPYSYWFLFILDFEYSVLSSAYYKNSIIEGLSYHTQWEYYDEINKIVHKNNKLYFLVRIFDFVIIDFDIGLQDRFRGGVGYDKYYVHPGPYSITDPSQYSPDDIWFGAGGGAFRTPELAYDNASIYKVTSEADNIVKFKIMANDLTPRDRGIFFLAGVIYDTVGCSLVPSPDRLLVVNVDSDDAYITFAYTTKDSGAPTLYQTGYYTIRFERDTFIGNQTGDFRDVKIDFDVDSDGDIYVVSNFFSPEFSNAPVNAMIEDWGKTFATLNYIVEGTEFADVLKISGDTGVLLDSSVYAVSWLNQKELGGDLGPTQGTDINSGFLYQSKNIVVTDDGVWVSGTQIWPQYGYIWYSSLYDELSYFFPDTAPFIEVYISAWNTDAISIYSGEMTLKMWDADGNGKPLVELPYNATSVEIGSVLSSNGVVGVDVDGGPISSTYLTVEYSQTGTPSLGIVSPSPTDAGYSYNLLLFDFNLSLKDTYYFGPNNMKYGETNLIRFPYTEINDMTAIGNNVYITGDRRHDDITISSGM